MGRTTKSITLDQEDAENFTKYAKATGRDFSKLVTVSVKEYMKNN
jgi:hypothetical protein